jgi:LCP family protein required for cell wall assembly
LKAPRRKLKRKVPFILCFLVLLALFAYGCVLAKNAFFPDAILNAGEDDDSPPVIKGERLNVLLLGIDARQGETVARTDSIILASVDPESKQMSLLSIPRDTRVNIPKHGWDKINSATVYGGPQVSMKVVSDLLGIPVGHYVLTNFSGFKDIVDALGGVTLDVERNMYHEDITDGGIYRINLKKGVQRLNGDKALQYVRFRDYDLGDVDRTKYQQKFLVALAKEMLQPSTITKLPKLVPEINRYIKTNLSMSDMLTMVSAARQLADGEIVCQTLPGRPLDINGGSYWGVDPAEAKQMVTNLFKGETTSTVVMNTPLTGRYAPPRETVPAVSTGDKETPASGGDLENPDTAEKTGPGQDKTTVSPNKAGGDGVAPKASGTNGKVVITPVKEGDNKDNRDNDNEDEDEDDLNKQDDEDDTSNSNEVNREVKDPQNTQDGQTAKNSGETAEPGNDAGKDREANGAGTDTGTGSLPPKTKGADGDTLSPAGLAVTERTGGSALN